MATPGPEPAERPLAVSTEQTHQFKSRVGDEALRLARLGLHVLPLKPRDKTPLTQHGFKDATTDQATLKDWWRQFPTANIGIATGSVSGIVVADVDPRNGGSKTLNHLLARHGPLPVTVESLTGAGGQHLFFRHPGGHVKSCSNALGPGVDIKADGGYVVAPPSVHPNGTVYAWQQNCAPGDTELARAPQWLLDKLCQKETAPHSDPIDCVTERTESTEENGSNVSVLSVTDAVKLQIQQAIESTLPKHQGTRHKAVFEFCRALKAITALCDAKPIQLRVYVKRWHQAALPYIGTKPFEDTWADFINGWPRVIFPKGQEPMAMILKLADQSPPPPEVMDYDSPETKRLICVCRELQRVSGGGPFYLSCRTAGGLLEIDHMTAWRRLAVLVADGILELVKVGTKTHAARYRYLGRM